jgi:ATP-dependent helicase HrpB
LPRFDPPEILEADLSGLVLDCAIWGVADPRTLAWLDPPPEAAVAEGRARLATLEALDADGRPTPHGRAIAKLPMPPRLAHMLVRAGEMGLAREAAEVAVLLGERGLGGPGTDLETRVRRFRSERGGRAESARRLAERWANIPLPLAGGAREGRVENNGKQKTSPPPAPPASGRGEAIATAVALAFPDRISRRRDASGERWVSVGGRGFKLDATDPLATAQWLAVA